MTEHAELHDAAATDAQDLLDAMLPRRDPRYQAALAYLTAYLQADAATRRLAMRALKSNGRPGGAQEGGE